MAATVNLTQAVNATIKGAKIELGSKSTPVVLTLSEDNYIDYIQTLANNITFLAWESLSTYYTVTSFSLLVIQPTEDLLVELSCDKDADFGTRQIVLKARADFPLILTSDFSIANHATNFGSGTDDVIDRVRIRNVSGSSNDVRIIIAK